MDRYSSIRLENQLCFPLYALSREVIKLYTPLLEKFGLTYTQYIAMLVIWEFPQISFRDLTAKLYLDSGTLTSVVKKLVRMELVEKTRLPEDDRVVVLTLTETGRRMQDEILEVPAQLYATFAGQEDLFRQLKANLDASLEQITRPRKG